MPKSYLPHRLIQPSSSFFALSDPATRPIWPPYRKFFVMASTCKTKSNEIQIHSRGETAHFFFPLAWGKSTANSSTEQLGYFALISLFAPFFIFLSNTRHLRKSGNQRFANFANILRSKFATWGGDPVHELTTLGVAKHELDRFLAQRL